MLPDGIAPSRQERLLDERNIMGELNMYRQLGVKPNFSDIARRYGLDRHTVASYWKEGGDVDDGRCRRGSGFDRHRALIEEKAALPGARKKAVHEYLLHRCGDPDLPGYNAFTHYCRTRGIPFVSATAKSAERATLSRRRRPRFPAGGATALWPPALPRAAAQGALDRGVVEVRGPDLNLQRRGALGVPGRDRPARDLPSAELREPDRHRDVLCAERGQPPRGVRGPHDCPLSGSPSPSAASASRSFMR